MGRLVKIIKFGIYLTKLYRMMILRQETCLDRMNGFRHNDIMTCLDRMRCLDIMTE